MRILVIPRIYSGSHISSISTVATYMDMISGLNRFRDDLEWLFAVPETPNYVRWSLEDFSHLKRVTILPILADGSSELGVADGFTRQDLPFFGPKAFKYFASQHFLGIDVVISSHHTAQFIPRFQRDYDAKYFYTLPKVGLPQIINYLTITRLHPGMPSMRTVDGERLTAMSVAASYMTVVVTEPDVPDTLRLCSDYLSRFQCKDIRITEIPCAVDPKQLPKFKRPKGRANFFYGGTFEANKHVKDWARLLEKVYATGGGVKLVLVSQWPKAPEWANKPFIETHLGVNRNRYHEKLERGDFLLCWYDYMGTGIGTTEAIMSGMTPIFKESAGTKGRYPKNYRLMAKSEDSLAAILQSVAKDPYHHQDLEKRSTNIAKWTKEKFGIDTTSQKWSAILDQVMLARNLETIKRCGTGSMALLVTKVVDEMPDICSEKELFTSIANESRSLKLSDLMHMKEQIRALAMAFGAVSLPGNRYRGFWHDHRSVPLKTGD